MNINFKLKNYNKNEHIWFQFHGNTCSLSECDIAFLLIIKNTKVKKKKESHILGAISKNERGQESKAAQESWNFYL